MMVKNSERYVVLKEALCPYHNKKIENINLSPHSDDNDRLYCKDCEIKNNDFVFTYEEVFMKLKQSKKQFLDMNGLFEKIKIIQNILSVQIQRINIQLQEYQNFLLSFPIEDDSLQKLLSQGSKINFEDLLEIIKKLSEVIKKKQKKISFKKLHPDPKISNIQQSILTLENCAIKIAEIMNFKDQPLTYPIIDQSQSEQIQTINFDVLDSVQVSNTSAIDLGIEYGYIAVAEKEQRDGHYTIDIFNLDLEKNKIMLKQKLTGHKDRINIVQAEYNLLSVDTGRQIILREIGKQGNFLFVWQCNAEKVMRYITCVALSWTTNCLILGGDKLIAWKFDTFDEQQILKESEDEIVCIKLKQNQRIIISGTKKGEISQFYYSNSKWQLIFNVITQNEVRQFFFLSNKNFISIQKGNQWTKWVFNKELEEYEHKSQQIQDLDNAVIFGEALVKPIIRDSNGQLVEFDLCSTCSQHIAIIKNNLLQIYGARQ